MPSKDLKNIFNNTVLILLLFAAAAVWLAVAFRPDNLLHIYFCDVGQGDAILIKTPQNKQILVDGGPGDQVLNCLSQALPFYDRSLDLLIMTHPHADHLGGLPKVLGTYEIKKAIFYQVAYPSADFREFVDLISKKQVENLEVVAGDVLALDQQTRADVWYPLSNDKLKVLGTAIDPYDGENVNDSSIILRLVCGDFEALLTGDAPDSVQQLLLGQEMVREADVLKIAHHGGREGLDKNFLQKVTPRLAIISVGAHNRYGHPHAETLAELRQAKVEVRRTDLDGTIEVVSDCDRWWLK
jgi:competence protein ComEC